MDLGNRLYEFRKEKRISQEEAAEKLNVTRQTVSKWETNQSQPDFDKIIPICELYGITTDDLFGTTTKKETKPTTKTNTTTPNLRKKTAFVVSISVFLYFISVIWIIMASTFSWLNENILVSIFLFICAIATIMLVYHFISLPKEEEEEKIKNKKEIEKYDGVIALIFTSIYLFVSFATSAWHITWLLWVVFALVIEIVHLLLGERYEK